MHELLSTDIVKSVTVRLASEEDWSCLLGQLHELLIAELTEALLLLLALHLLILGVVPHHLPLLLQVAGRVQGLNIKVVYALGVQMLKQYEPK